jgi:hypothetical protein
MSFLRHVGKHGDRKVAIVFREVPGEPHMCLVVYPEILNQHIHDPLMQCIESDIGQSSENLADALNRTYTKDGTIILQKLHSEGMLKKVNTEQIIMTPQPNTKIRLNELNKMLDEMKLGEEAVKRMAELDASRGMQDPAEVARRMRGNKDAQVNQPVVATSGDALGDAALANNLRQQATKMTNEAKGLMAEAQRLLKEAASMDPVKPKKETTKKTATLDATPKTKTSRVKKVNVA